MRTTTIIASRQMPLGHGAVQPSSANTGFNMYGLMSGVQVMAKELVPIVLGCAVWGPLLAKRSTVFQCDNHGLVQAINKGSSRDLMVMHLLRCLWFFTAFFDMQIMAIHIPGAENNSANMLSRNQATQFLRRHPQASRLPTLLPPPPLHIVSPLKPDWTSSSFLKHLKESLAQIQHLADRNF